MYRKQGKIHRVKLLHFSRFSGVPWNFSCEYKHLSLIVLNNEHLLPRQHGSISMKTLMALKKCLLYGLTISTPPPLCNISRITSMYWLLYNKSSVTQHEEASISLLGCSLYIVYMELCYWMVMWLRCNQQVLVHKSFSLHMHCHYTTMVWG